MFLFTFDGNFCSNPAIAGSFGLVGNVVCRINKVNQHLAQLYLGW